MAPHAPPRKVPLDQAFDASPNAYMVLDRELRFVAANRAYLALTASDLDDLLGNYVLARFPHDASNPENENARLLRTSLEKVLATGERDDIALIRYRVPRFAGGPLEERFWSATHVPLLDEDRRVEFIVQHTVDVTEIERLKAAASTAPVSSEVASFAAGLIGRAEVVQQKNITLDEQLGRLRRLFEQAPGFTAVLTGPNHVFDLTNAAYRSLIGNRDVIGKSIREALPDIAGQGFYERLDTVYTSGEPFLGEGMAVFLQRRPDGPLEETILDFIYQPIFDGSGKVGGIFVQGNDITEEARAKRETERLSDERERLLVAEQGARQEAERANRLKDEFLATVSHELRTPLTAILGWLQMIREGELAGERREHALSIVERNAHSLKQLVEDFLDVSRIISGKMNLEVEPVLVMSAVEAAIEAVRPAAVAKNIRIQSTLDSKASVMGDAGRLQQVVWNLLSNAVKFTPKAGRVQVVVERRESSIAIVVADTGIGLEPDFLPHVFDRFSQAESSSTRRHGGLGLGLSIVKHLVELHGGTISVTSDGPGKGATFTVTLPIALSRRSPSDPELRKIECPSEIVGLRVLVIEDDDDTRDLLLTLLTNFGAIAETADSVAAGIRAFQTMKPDVIISDIGMPGEDGHAFARWLRSLPESEGGRTPAIALTAFARTEDRTAVLRSGFRAHVPKPLDVGELLAVIGSVVAPR
jgi:signal transduction histidine kinase